MTEKLYREALLEIAEKELAAAQVDVIGNTFAELDTFKQALGAAKSHAEKAEEESIRDKKLISTLQENVTIDLGLAARESAVTGREHMCELAEVRLECEVEKRELVLDMFRTVFRNGEVKRTVFGNSNRSWTDENSMSRLDTDQHEETVTEREEGWPWRQTVL